MKTGNEQAREWQEMWLVEQKDETTLEGVNFEGHRQTTTATTNQIDDEGEWRAFQIIRNCSQGRIVSLSK